MRHETAPAKVPLVAQCATELLDGEARKIVIFAHHRDVVARLQDELKRFRPVILVGGMAPQARQDGIDAFQADSTVRVFIGNIQAPEQGSHSLPQVRFVFSPNSPGFPPTEPPSIKVVSYSCGATGRRNGLIPPWQRARIKVQ